MSVADADRRERALDPVRSFCVTAPAGSGKTELLIQRYLGLLSRVERPEQVLAITFTRKAAAEMRARVLAALEEAAVGAAPAGDHQRRTRELALAALGADRERGWLLRRDSNRLNIKTIDSFCHGLAGQMPVLSRLGGRAAVTDNAGALYAEAVAELFRVLDSGDPPADDLRSLLAHFDNDWQRVQELLVALLARRDQWGEYLGLRHHPEEAEKHLLDTVAALVRDALAALQSQLGDEVAELLALARFAAGNLGDPEPDGVPGVDPSDLPAWQALAALLLTGGGQWRSRVDKRTGFPPGSNAQKERLYDLIARLRERDGLCEALGALRHLPQARAGDPAWQLALRLIHLLPRLAAELLLVFARHGVMDHGQVALSALQALGDDDSPTDLALRLDYRIEHILVDEFQDTAINQYELVRRLTRGWGEHNQQNPGAPRTLFIVGDGMQSIYGFRDANVGLFLKARLEGFNGVLPEALDLLCNFRSDAGIVDWVNSTFARAFPDVDDIRLGQVSFTPAVAVRGGGAHPAVSALGFSGEDAAGSERSHICELVKTWLQQPDCGSIAILGRSRSQLRPLLADLSRHGIACAAQDVGSLADSAAVADLLCLCRALASSADRVAWLALLRAPWCGLSLADLHVIGSGGGVIWRVMWDPKSMEALSGDGRQRLTRLRNALATAHKRRDRLALREWLEQLWLSLSGPATLADSSGLAEAEQFFRLLERADEEGRGLDPAWLSEQLAQQSAPPGDPSVKVQVMTLHRAKGLEFERVIIPGLARQPRGDDRDLLLWGELVDGAGRRGFLLAADDRAPTATPTLYNWLRRRRREKSRLENTRLLYVGATRAVRQLCLTACLQGEEGKGEWREPPADSLLHPVWPTFMEQMQSRTTPPGEQQPTACAGQGLSRVADVPAAAALTGARSDRGNSAAFGGSTNRVRRHAGTVVHLALQELAARDSLPDTVGDCDRGRWRAALRGLGLAGEQLGAAQREVEHSLTRTLADPAGRRLLAGWHSEARSEWALTHVRPDGSVEDLVVDRCFVDRDSGDRWIVDYKTSAPGTGESRAAFLARESQRYREQLLRYRNALSEIGPQPLRCGLYFTALGHLEELVLNDAGEK